MTPEQLRELIAPSSVQLHQLRSYFAGFGVSELRVLRSGDVVRVRLNVSQVEKAFGVTMKHFGHHTGMFIKERWEKRRGMKEGRREGGEGGKEGRRKEGRERGKEEGEKEVGE